MELEIEVLFSPNISSFLEEGKPDGVSVRVLPAYMQRDLDFEPVATVVIGFASNVAAGLFVHWLLQKVPERARKKITIRKRKTTWDKDELIRVIEEEREIEQS